MELIEICLMIDDNRVVVSCAGGFTNMNAVGTLAGWQSVHIPTTSIQDMEFSH